MRSWRIEDDLAPGLVEPENGWRRFPVVMGKTAKSGQMLFWQTGRNVSIPKATSASGPTREECRNIRTWAPTRPKPSKSSRGRRGCVGPRFSSGGRHRDRRTERPKELARMGRRVPLPKVSRAAPEPRHDGRLSYRPQDFIAGNVAEYPNQLQAVDILRCSAGIEKQGLTARTRSNRFGSLCTFLRFCKVDVASIVPRETRKKLSRFPKTEPTAYVQDELDRLLFVCDDYYRLLFTFLSNTGFGMQEAMYLTWADVSFVDRVVSVKRKPGVFEVKDYEERSVPLLTSLAAALLVWQQRRKNTRLVFGTRSDRPNGHWLEYLKAYATKAGLNCGSCAGCQKEPPECEKFRIHKLRATYCDSLAEERSGRQNRPEAARPFKFGFNSQIPPASAGSGYAGKRERGFAGCGFWGIVA